MCFGGAQGRYPQRHNLSIWLLLAEFWSAQVLFFVMDHDQFDDNAGSREARNRELKFENWCLNFWRKVSGSAQFVDCTLNLSHFYSTRPHRKKHAKTSSRVHSCQIWSKKSSQVLLGSQTHFLKMVHMSVFNQPWKLCPSSPIGQASFKAEAEAILKALEYTNIVVFWDSC